MEADNSLKRVKNFVQERSAISFQLQKEHYDKSSKVTLVKVSSLVMRFYPPNAKSKLGCRWICPYKVMHFVGDTNVAIKMGRKCIVVHLNDVKPYDGGLVPENSSDKSEDDYSLEIENCPDSEVAEKEREKGRGRGKEAGLEEQ